jgi:hypothetical protein
MPLNLKFKEDNRMKKVIFMALCAAILFLVPNLSLGECTDIGYFGSFSLEGQNTVVLYAGSQPVVRFDIQNCSVKPSSKIQLIKSYVCDGDEILIDGSRCVMMNIKPLGP